MTRIIPLMAILLAAWPAAAETPSLQLTAPAYLLRDDNPLRRGKPYDGAVAVEIGGYRYDPPIAVPAAPRTWPPEPDVVEADQILSHLKMETELGGEISIHAMGWLRDTIIVLASVERKAPARVVLPLFQDSGGNWRYDEAALAEPAIDALRAAWDENGWIEVIDGDKRGMDQ